MADVDVGTGPVGTGPAGSELYEILVNDTPVRLTLEQLKTEAQKARGVMPTIQSERDKLKSEFEELSGKNQIMSDFLSNLEKVVLGQDGASEALDKMCEAMQVSKKDLLKRISTSAGVRLREERAARRTVEDEDVNLDEDEDTGLEAEETVSHGRMDSSTAHRPRLTLDDLASIDPDLVKDLAYARNRRLTDIREGVHKDLDSVFDSDEFLHKIVTGEDAKKVKVVKDLGRQVLRRRVNLEKAEAGPRLYREVAVEVRQLLEDLGIQAGGEPKKRVGLEALGLAGTDLQFSPDELYQEQAPDRVSPVSGKYKESLFKRIAHKVVQAGGLKRFDEEE